MCTNRVSIEISDICVPNSRGRVCSLFLNGGFGFSASDAFSLALLDICPEGSLRQVGLGTRIVSHCRLPNGSLTRCRAQQPNQPSDNGSSRPRTGRLQPSDSTPASAQSRRLQLRIAHRNRVARVGGWRCSALRRSVAAAPSFITKEFFRSPLGRFKVPAGKAA